VSRNQGCYVINSLEKNKLKNKVKTTEFFTTGWEEKVFLKTKSYKI